MTPEGVVTAWVLLGAIFAFIGGFVGRTNDRSEAGIVLGFLLGPFGVVAVAAMTPSRTMVAAERRKLAEELARAINAVNSPQESSGAPEQEPQDPRRSVPKAEQASRTSANEETDGKVPATKPYIGMKEGFYVDPLDSTRERYWGGREWDTVTYPRGKRTPQANPAR